MNDITKAFIEANIDLIEDNELETLFHVAVQQLKHSELWDLIDALELIGIETEGTRYKLLADAVTNYVTDSLNAPAFARDDSTGWARLDYMLDGIELFGFAWSDAKQWILDNQKRVGLVLTELEPEYGWQGVGDYAFQWFNKKKFEKEYWV